MNSCTTDKESQQTKFDGCDIMQCRFMNGCPLLSAEEKKIVYVCILYCCDHKNVSDGIECLLTSLHVQYMTQSVLTERLRQQMVS